MFRLKTRSLVVVCSALLLLSWVTAVGRGKVRPVIPAALPSLITQADKVVVYERPSTDAKVLFTSTKKEDISALANAARVLKPDGVFRCMCEGSPAISMYKGDVLLVQITSHHGQSIRCDQLWDSDALLADAELLLKWFEVRNMPGPRKEVEEAKARWTQGQKDKARWVAAVPKGLEKIWDQDLDFVGRPQSLTPHRAALEAAFPSAQDRVLALYSWFGSGSGPWSGFPAYEDIAEQLLLTYSTAELVEAAESSGMATPAHWEGAARLFGGWTFSKERPEGLAQVPVPLKESFWNHVKNTKDEDKLGRVEVAFLPLEPPRK